MIPQINLRARASRAIVSTRARVAGVIALFIGETNAAHAAKINVEAICFVDKKTIIRHLQPVGQ